MKNECSIIRDILPLYVENMVSEDTSEFVKEHLESCPACRAELEKLRTAPPLSKSIWIHAKNAVHCPPVKIRPLPLTRTRSSAPVKPAFCGR